MFYFLSGRQVRSFRDRVIQRTRARASRKSTREAVLACQVYSCMTCKVTQGLGNHLFSNGQCIRAGLRWRPEADTSLPMFEVLRGLITDTGCGVDGFGWHEP